MTDEKDKCVVLDGLPIHQTMFDCWREIIAKALAAKIDEEIMYEYNKATKG